MQWPFRVTIFLPSALLHDIFENTLTEGTHVCGVLIRVHLEKRKKQIIGKSSFVLEMINKNGWFW